jgi:hypothetical protein
MTPGVPVARLIPVAVRPVAAFVLASAAEGAGFLYGSQPSQVVAVDPCLNPVARISEGIELLFGFEVHATPIAGA